MPSGPNTSSAASANSGSDKGDKDAAVAKAAGLVVFSGIAMSIIKSLASKFQQPPVHQHQTPPPQPPQPPQPFHQPPPPTTTHPRDYSKKLPAEGSGALSSRIVEIVKGDTLWGLSRKYGVSIDAIKEANGLKGNTIYAGKKLVIPS